MNKFLAAAAFAVVLVPAFANAASTSYDPGADSGSPMFVQLPTHVSSANAAAAAADAARYNTASSAVIGTHGAAPTTVTEYDPGLASGNDLVTKTILPGAVAPIAPQHYIPYADNSAVIGD